MNTSTLPDPARIHEHRADARLVRYAFEQLSPDDRELATLTAWEGLTPTQAAAALGLTPGAARTRLHPGRLRASLTSLPTDPEDHDHDH